MCSGAACTQLLGDSVYKNGPVLKYQTAASCSVIAGSDSQRCSQVGWQPLLLHFSPLLPNPPSAEVTSRWFKMLVPLFLPSLIFSFCLLKTIHEQCGHSKLTKFAQVTVLVKTKEKVKNYLLGLLFYRWP